MMMTTILVHGMESRPIGQRQEIFNDTRDGHRRQILSADGWSCLKCGNTANSQRCTAQCRAMKTWKPERTDGKSVSDVVAELDLSQYVQATLLGNEYDQRSSDPEKNLPELRKPNADKLKELGLEDIDIFKLVTYNDYYKPIDDHYYEIHKKAPGHECAGFLVKDTTVEKEAQRKDPIEKILKRLHLDNSDVVGALKKAKFNTFEDLEEVDVNKLRNAGVDCISTCILMKYFHPTFYLHLGNDDVDIRGFAEYKRLGGKVLSLDDILPLKLVDCKEALAEAGIQSYRDLLELIANPRDFRDTELTPEQRERFVEDWRPLQTSYFHVIRTPKAIHWRKMDDCYFLIV